MIIQPVNPHDGAQSLQQRGVVAADLLGAVQLAPPLLQLDRHVRARRRRARVHGGEHGLYLGSGGWVMKDWLVMKWLELFF